MKKIVMGMWVPNSFAGHKMWSLEGENEIPHIPLFDFLAKTCLSPFWVELVRKCGIGFEDRLALHQYIS